MAAYEVLLLNTAIPQIQAAQSGDTYVVPRDIAINASASITGNLGVGVANPAAKLVVENGHVNMTTDYGARWRAASAGAYNGALLFDSGNNLIVQTGSALTERMRLDSSGNLGIGLGGANPAAKLDVQGATADQIRVRTAATEFYRFGRNASTGFLDFYGSQTGYQGYTFGGVDGTWATINASGNLLVGATSTLIAGVERFRVDGATPTTSSGAYPGTMVVSDNRAYNSTSPPAGGGIAFAYKYTSGSAYAVGPSIQGFKENTTNNDYAGGLRFLARANGSNPLEAARITSVGNLKLGGTADRATTVGTNHLDIFNGTAPVGTLTNGISIYSSSGEAYVMDAAGNATLFSPHDAETNEWIFKSKHTPTGKVLKIDVERLLKFVNDHFGLDAVHEFVEE